MTRPRKWADRAPVEAVTHEPEPSGLLEAWEAVPAGVLPACSPECGARVERAGGRAGAAQWGEQCVACGCVIGGGK